MVDAKDDDLTAVLTSSELPRPSATQGPLSVRRRTATLVAWHAGRDPVAKLTVARSRVFVLHACWRRGADPSQPGSLAVWGEDSSAPAHAPRKPGRAPRLQPHPFAAAHE